MNFKSVKSRNLNHPYRIFIFVMACVVVLGTIYALMLPAITLEKETFCRLEEHTHGEECYTDVSSETQVHLICIEETECVHEHTAECYAPAETEIVVEYHTHTENCYIFEQGELKCGQTEGVPEVQAEELPEMQTEALSEIQTEELPEAQTEVHVHDESCYEWNTVLNCGMDESTVVSESVVELEPELTCAEPEVAEHIHTEACYETVAAETVEPECICQLEEHTHDVNCYIDLTADLETASDWERTFAHVALTGIWADDVIAIAETQLGYHESASNYQIQSDGVSTKGYTRYGEWYGDPYGDWCAMFVSFCLRYAGVNDIPIHSNCVSWIETLTEAGLYYSADSYTPMPGDIIFFEYDGDDRSDHVGLVYEVIYNEDGQATSIRTIEGNSTDQVEILSYSLSNSCIYGYGMVGTQLTETEQEQVDQVIALIDAMPSADEIDAKLAEYEEAEDYDGEEAYYMEVCQQVAEAYYYYDLLNERQKMHVTNVDKLLELEYIWSVTTYIAGFDWTSPTTVTAASTSDFIDFNIFDYSGNINTLYNSNNNYPGFQWNGGAYLKGKYDRHQIDYIDFGNSLITDFTYGSTYSDNNPKSSNAQMIGKTDDSNGAINKLDDSSYGITNRPIGMSLNNSITDTSEDVLSRTLGSDGYPALKDGTSLAYLFQNGSYAIQKNTASVDGLFQQNTTTGEYHYNSRLNHAQYSNNRFTLYNQIITPNFITYPFGNFLPFNDITDSSKATQVGSIDDMGNYVQWILNKLVANNAHLTDVTKHQLVDMLARYRTDLQSVEVGSSTAWAQWDAADAIEDYFTTGSGDNPSDDTSLITNALLNKMYNIDWDVKTNFFFGMDMTMNFMQPKDGMTGNDTNQDGESDYPMKFYFTGDDDVWVYIDGVLFLDLSGIHRHVGGEIDFVNGKVYYYYLDTANTGDVSTTPYQTYTFKEILSAAGKSTDGLNSKGTFKDYTIHNFKFYYMERGSGSSVCRLNFNFPLLKQNTISVSKELTSDDSTIEALGNPDFRFQVLKANSDGTKTQNLFIGAGVSYTIYDASDNKIGTGTTDANGVFTLKAGQRAEFEGIKENAGKYYVRELLEGTVLEQYGNITVSGESTTTNNNIVIGSDTFTGVESPVKDMSDGAAAFRFNNRITTENLGDLSISKKLTEYATARVVKYFDIQVSLDGQLLPVGTVYKVGDEERVVETEGIIRIAADEKALLENILAGTEFEIVETSESAEGYIVTYLEENGYTVEQTESGIRGVMTAGADVQLIVNNSEKGTSVTLSGTKGLTTYDDKERTFTFQLVEVADASGTPMESEVYTSEVLVKDKAQEFSFTLNYVQTQVQTLPKTFYYQITEAASPEAVVNHEVYIVEVKVESNGEDGILSSVTNMWKGQMVEGKPTNLEACSELKVDFVNTLLGDLVLSKSVIGNETAMARQYTFEIELISNDREIPEIYSVERMDSDGNTSEETLTFKDGKTTVPLKSGESLWIKDIPYGTSWKVVEESLDGYEVTYSITSNGLSVQNGSGTEAEGQIVSTKTEIEYVNRMAYELPQTGGNGTLLYTVLSIALIACGMTCMIYIKKHRKG